MTSLPPPPQSYLEAYSGNVLIGVCSAFIALETIFLALRFYARSLAPLQWTWEDLLLPFAWLFNVGLCSLCINSVPAAGVGRHLAYVKQTDPHQLIAWGKTLVALEWLYLSSNPLPKIYVLCLYLRIFTQRAARVTCYVMIGVIIAIWVSFIVASATKCTPFAAQWDKTIGHCVNVEAYYQAGSAPNMATDVVILLLPIPTLIALHASVVRKIGLLLIFVTGSIGLVGSVIRFSIFFRSDAFSDNTWVSVSLMSWTCVEPGMYLIAACCLTLRPLFAKFPFKGLGSKLETPGAPSSFQSTTAANMPRRSGFIQMKDLENQSAGPKMNVTTTTSFTVDVESAKEHRMDRLGTESYTHK
ncbi:hypothetical protein LAWI1_G000884 [Lachnellula willkommii]|uniref:Rhodopsin domain-containing protein n=1 Tax=Lachnellula willkommii TaxID=215461 RepID=A0A559MLA9_9HELO|nr:hypothetical protein LAWI1_G000884 [Lachnellula willkommii]